MMEYTNMHGALAFIAANEGCTQLDILTGCPGQFSRAKLETWRQQQQKDRNLYSAREYNAARSKTGPPLTRYFTTAAKRDAFAAEQANKKAIIAQQGEESDKLIIDVVKKAGRAGVESSSMADLWGGSSANQRFRSLVARGRIFDLHRGNQAKRYFSTQEFAQGYQHFKDSQNPKSWLPKPVRLPGKVPHYYAPAPRSRYDVDLQPGKGQISMDQRIMWKTNLPIAQVVEQNPVTAELGAA